MKSGISDNILKRTTIHKKSEKGYITAEACISIPVFVFVILFFVSFIRLYITREIIQHAIVESSAEVILYTEVLCESGIFDKLLDMDEGANESTINYFTELLTNIIGNIDISRNNGKENSVTQHDNFSGIFDLVSEILNSANNNLYFNANGSVINEAYVYVLKKQFIKSLEKHYGNKTESILMRLGICNGLKGINFNDSYISLAGNNKLKISVVYKYSTGVPLKGLNTIEVKHHLLCNLWMDGDASLFNLESGYESDKNEDNIWLLSNFERGRKIRKIFGANLPIGYQGISRFENGKATLIKSMDLTAPTYASPEETFKRIKRIIDGLIHYTGNDKPWGSQEIIIREEDIIQKELLLVIPKDKIENEIQKELDFLQHYAYFNNIAFTIVKYGYKNADQTQIQNN